jgi:hypothetical protein
MKKLKKDIYMIQLKGFAEIGKENLVFRLNKTLYGLKQVPKCCYKRFDYIIISLGYNKIISDHCIYYKKFEEEGDFIILLLYMDDILIVDPNKDRFHELKA